MPDVHETLGRVYQAHMEQLEEYRKLLHLIARIQSGEVDPGRIMILPNDAWEIRPEGVPPEAMRLPTVPPTE